MAIMGELLQQNDVWFTHDPKIARDHRYMPFRYCWTFNNPPKNKYPPVIKDGSTGKKTVFCHNSLDFQRLMKIWSKNGWIFSE